VKRLSLRLHADEEHWIPLSDLMTGLMMLFLLISIAYMLAVEHQQTQPKRVLQTYAQTRALLANDLQRTFGADFARWSAAFDPRTLSIRFPVRAVLFAPGSAQLQPRFRKILRDFFPRYVRILEQPQYRSIISEVRVEGYTSSLWRPGATLEERYLGNLALSQDRARNVLAYALWLPAIAAQRPWLMQVLTADGLSFSHLVRKPNGQEDVAASERVVFRVRTDAAAQVDRALALQAAPPRYPAWAVAMIGKPLRALFPKVSTRCVGFLDRAHGRQLGGWGYDLQADAPLRRVLIADSSGIVTGAGTGGFPRPDVPASLPRITSQTTGWQGAASTTGRPLRAWGIMTAPGTVCALGTSARF
jgi:outer membrane protein OmpA-like peptidoglycan-associated protein